MKKIALAALLTVMGAAAFGQVVSGTPTISAPVSFSVLIDKFASITPPSALSLEVTNGTSGVLTPVSFLYFTNCPFTISGAITLAPVDGNGTTLVGTTLTGTIANGGVSNPANGGTTQLGSSATVGFNWNGNLSTEAGNYTGGVITITITSP
jgi:hypothetical protein